MSCTSTSAHKQCSLSCEILANLSNFHYAQVATDQSCLEIEILLLPLTQVATRQSPSLGHHTGVPTHVCMQVVMVRPPAALLSPMLPLAKVRKLRRTSQETLRACASASTYTYAQAVPIIKDMIHLGLFASTRTSAQVATYADRLPISELRSFHSYMCVSYDLSWNSALFAPNYFHSHKCVSCDGVEDRAAGGCKWLPLTHVRKLQRLYVEAELFQKASTHACAQIATPVRYYISTQHLLPLAHTRKVRRQNHTKYSLAHYTFKWPAFRRGGLSLRIYLTECYIYVNLLMHFSV